MRIGRFAALALLVLATISGEAEAGDLSVSIDFDGSGAGQLYTAAEPPTPPGGSVRTFHRVERFRPPSAAELEAFERAREREQQAQAAARAAAAAALDRADRAARLDRLGIVYDLWQHNEALDDEAEEQQTRARIAIRDAMPEFIRQQERDRQRYDAQLRALKRAISKIVVPSPKLCDSMLLLGVGATASEAGAVSHESDPFTGKPYNCGVYGFAWTNQYVDLLLRGIPDHIGQSYDWLSPITRRSLAQLGEQSRIVPSLVVHSNGLAVAEALIRSKRILGVSELRVLGGDGSLMNLDGLQRLADDYGIKVTVYAIKGDPVPLAPLGWNVMRYGQSLMSQIAGYSTQPNLTYRLLGLERRPAEPSANLQVKLLDYPSRANPIDYHPYEAYAHLLNGLSRMGCLSGRTDSRCNVSY